MKKTMLLLWLVILPTTLLAQVEDKPENTEEYLAKNFTVASDTLKYRIRYPKNFSKDEKYPLILFLHGAGERGDDNERQLIHGKKLFKNSKSNSAIIVLPQCPADDYWSNVEIDRGGEGNTFHFKNGGEPTKALSMVMELMEELLSEGYVREEQIYVGGLSMGGMGSFEILSRMPDMFAAAFPICGGAHPETVEAYAGKSDLWIFHGARDKVVSPEHSIEMARAINKAGGTADLTIYGDATHNSWDRAFQEPNLFDWLFSKTRTK